MADFLPVFLLTGTANDTGISGERSINIVRITKTICLTMGRSHNPKNIEYIQILGSLGIGIFLVFIDVVF